MFEPELRALHWSLGWFYWIISSETLGFYKFSPWNNQICWDVLCTFVFLFSFFPDLAAGWDKDMWQSGSSLGWLFKQHIVYSEQLQKHIETCFQDVSSMWYFLHISHSFPRFVVTSKSNIGKWSTVYPQLTWPSGTYQENAVFSPPKKKAHKNHLYTANIL